jgi:hypothetical protein
MRSGVLSAGGRDDMIWSAGEIGENVQASIDKGMMNICSYCGGDAVDMSCDKCGDVVKLKCTSCLSPYLAPESSRQFTTLCLECFVKN